MQKQKRKKMNDNLNLNKANKEKNDEFYTFYSDVEKEIENYVNYNPDLFRDKIILLPCETQRFSEFYNYFHNNYKRFKYKKVIVTSYCRDYNPLVNPNIRGSKMECNGEEVKVDKLKGDGDFRSKEITELRDEADFIITNPPFSLLRDFIEWVVNSGKQFSVLSNINVITNKTIFNFFKEGKIWVGDSTFNDGVYFKVDNDYIHDKKYKFLKEINGHKVIRVGSICWFTNIMFHRKDKKRNYNTMDLNIRDNKYKNLYKKYDGYDAIEIPNSKLIPSDYYGEMGVPVTFLNKLGIGSEFELLGLDDHRVEWKGSANSINGKQIYRRLIIRRKKL